MFYFGNKNLLFTVTSRLFTYIESTEKIRKDTRYRRNTIGIKYTYFYGCFLILLQLKVDLGFSHF